MSNPILLVEDDEPLRTFMARGLRGGGRSVTEVDSAEDAIQVLASGVRPCLVILDINLPGESGWELLRSGTFHDAGDPPVIVASATAIRPRRLREFNVSGYLPKPFPVETLTATVERLLSNTREEGEA
ncbi:MAG TPA: response regulator [Candidatus Limnocylindria bacterium]|jgi:CheY-like chemotaxis protein